MSRSAPLIIGCLLAAAGACTGTQVVPTSDDDDITGDDDIADDDDSAPIPPGDLVTDASARLHAQITSVAYVSWTLQESADSARVEYSFDEGVWLSTPVRDATVGDHEQIVLGVPYGATLQWRIVVEQEGGTVTTEEQSIEVGDLPPTMPSAEVDIFEDEWVDETGNYLFTSVTELDPLFHTDAGFWLVIVDRQGRVVWAMEGPYAVWTFFPKTSRSGEYLLWDESYYWTTFGGAADNGRINQMKLDGEIVHSWAAPNMHHSFDDLAPGTIVWNNIEGNDDILYLSVGDEPPERLWSCLDWIFAEGLGIEANPAWEECACNALSWNEDRGTVLVSIPGHEIVLELEIDTGEVLWFADPNRDLGYLVTPENAKWHWQHEPVLLPDGNLLLSCGVYDGAPGWTFDHTAAFEYSIDEQAQTLTLDWAYVSEESWAFAYRGGAERLPGGNTLHFYGDVGGARELTPDGDVVWQLRFHRPGGDAWIGRCRFIEDLYPFGP